MIDDDKLQAFLEVMVIHRKHTAELIKQYLIVYNPDPSMLKQLKDTLEDQNIFLENDVFDFFDKWKKYKETAHEAAKELYKESVDLRFKELMAKNFKGNL